MTKDSRKMKAQLLRDFRRSLRVYGVLYDSIHALSDPQGVKAVSDELKSQLVHIQKTADELAEMTQAMFRVTLTVDLDQSEITVREEGQTNEIR